MTTAVMGTLTDQMQHDLVNQVCQSCLLLAVHWSLLSSACGEAVGAAARFVGVLACNGRDGACVTCLRVVRLALVLTVLSPLLFLGVQVVPDLVVMLGTTLKQNLTNVLVDTISYTTTKAL